MKMGRSKWVYTLITVLLVAMLCIGLVAMTVADKPKDDIPAMANGEETESEAGTDTETEQESDTETEAEAEAETETEWVAPSSQGLEFVSLGNGTCYVSGMGSCRDSVLILPLLSPEGDRVVGIGDYAFRNCSYLRSLELHEGIRYIGAYAFYGSSLVNVVVPPEVESIGDYAFAGCKSLVAITVDADNQMYSDVGGVLYNKSTTVIIACPAGKKMVNYSISSQVSEIQTMAFYGCDTIKLVNYEGGASAFRRIHIGAGNEPIETAVVTFTGAVTGMAGGEK